MCSGAAMEQNYPVEVDERVRQIRAMGRYKDDAAILRMALDLLLEFESLRDKINAGITESEAVLRIPSDVVFAELRARAAEIAERHATERQTRFREALESTIEQYGEALRRLADQ